MDRSDLNEILRTARSVDTSLKRIAEALERISNPKVIVSEVDDPDIPGGTILRFTSVPGQLPLFSEP